MKHKSGFSGSHSKSGRKRHPTTGRITGHFMRPRGQSSSLPDQSSSLPQDTMTGVEAPPYPPDQQLPGAGG